MARVELLRPELDAAGLEAEWRALEERAGGSFFQGWTWVGCLARERFSRPVLLRATAEGRTVGLALFNERRRFGSSTLWLGETGDPTLDRVFVEHNGVLTERAWAEELPAWLRAAMRMPVLRAGTGRPGGRLLARRKLVLSGIGADGLSAAQAAGTVRVRATRPSPLVDLARLGPGGEGFLDRLSRNTRQQLRRSDRLYGSIEVRCATSPDEADAFLGSLFGLQERRFASQGRDSSLAQPAVARFLRELVARGAPRGEVDMLRIAAGGAAIGYLLNLRRDGWVGQYQGGFDYEGAGQHRKPGLTCHHAAIQHYRAQGATEYDFLAGADRYKLSLADHATGLHWAEVAPSHSLHSLVMKIRRILTAV
jgi:CelD/BcsL family acetyltransferase involved in cellulose biosynthesis